MQSKPRTGDLISCSFAGAAGAAAADGIAAASAAATLAARAVAVVFRVGDSAFVVADISDVENLQGAYLLSGKYFEPASYTLDGLHIIAELDLCYIIHCFYEKSIFAGVRFSMIFCTPVKMRSMFLVCFVV